MHNLCPNETSKNGGFIPLQSILNMWLNLGIWLEERTHQCNQIKDVKCGGWFSRVSAVWCYIWFRQCLDLPFSLTDFPHCRQVFQSFLQIVYSFFCSLLASHLHSLKIATCTSDIREDCTGAGDTYRARARHGDEICIFITVNTCHDVICNKHIYTFALCIVRVIPATSAGLWGESAVKATGVTG